MGFQNIPDTAALVYSDGTVSWTRSGSIAALCTFVGLRRMPYDNLGCQMHFGGFLLGDERKSDIITYKLGGFQRRTEYDYKQSYTEFQILQDKTSCDYYTGLPRNAFHCQMFFGRAKSHYFRFILLPNIIFTTLSFGQFFLDFENGERLSYSVTILLILVTQSLVASSLLPVCQERLWYVIPLLVIGST